MSSYHYIVHPYIHSLFNLILHDPIMNSHKIIIYFSPLFQLFLEATFAEASYLSNWETGFRRCEISNNGQFTNPRRLAIRSVVKGGDPYAKSDHLFNCKEESLGRLWTVHPADTRIGINGNSKTLQYALMEFPAFTVCTSAKWCGILHHRVDRKLNNILWNLLIES